MAKRDQLQQHLEGLFSDLSAEAPQVAEEAAPQPSADDLLRLFGEAPESPTPVPEPGAPQAPAAPPDLEPEPGVAETQAEQSAAQPVADVATQRDAALASAEGEPAAKVAPPQIRRPRPTTAQKMFLAFLLVALVPLLITLAFGSTPFVVLIALAIAGILALQLIQVSGWARTRTAAGTQHPSGVAASAPDTQTVALEGATDAGIQAENAALEQTIARLNRQTYHWSAGAAIARAVASSLDPQEVLQVAADAIQTQFHVHNVSFYVVDQFDAALVAVASSGEAAPEIVSWPQRWAIGDDNLVGAAYADGQARSTNDVPRGSQPLLPTSRSRLVVPLRAGGQRLGAMEIHCTEPVAFGDQETPTYGYIADMVALSLLNARRYADKKRLAQNQELTAALADRISQETDLQDVVAVTLRQLGATFKVAQATLCLGTETELTVAGNGNKKREP